MYYEDDFTGEGALTYVDANGEAWITYATSDSEGNFQSADQDMNYGSDPNYNEDKDGNLVARDENGKEIEGDALVGDASNGTITVRDVVAADRPAEILNFTFVGTGFEILSRTTDANYAVLNVVVSQNDEVVKRLPVICECENGDLYQVPVIAITDLGYGTYTVQLQVAYNASETNPTPRVYIDGIRIYSPLAADKKSEYYTPDEETAEIFKIKKLIVGENTITGGTEGEVAEKTVKAVYASVYENADSDAPQFTLAAGDTVIEDYAGSYILRSASDIGEYVTFGPNNELYLDGSGGTSVIAFYLKPVAGTTAEQRTIQIGAHRKTDSLDGDWETNTDYVTLVYGSTADIVENGEYSHIVASGTEQYYTIEEANLTADAQGRYLVLIGANFDCSLYATLALTNLKISGYEIEKIDFELEKISEPDFEMESVMATQLLCLRKIDQGEPSEPTEPTEPGVTP
jgi:hypothetical protein